MLMTTAWKKYEYLLQRIRGNYVIQDTRYQKLSENYKYIQQIGDISKKKVEYFEVLGLEIYIYIYKGP